MNRSSGLDIIAWKSKQVLVHQHLQQKRAICTALNRASVTGAGGGHSDTHGDGNSNSKLGEHFDSRVNE